MTQNKPLTDYYAMKKIEILCKLIVAGLALLFVSSCSEEVNQPDYKIEVTKLLKIKMDKSIDAAFIKGLSGINYNPVSMRKRGDTLFIANRADGSDGVLIVRESTGELLKVLTSWKYNGTDEFFDNQVIDVEVTPNLILVVNRTSRIDLFNRKDYSYITTIGTGKWWTSSLLQCESAVVVDDKIFIRDKQQVKVVRLADCTPENRFKVPNFAQNTDSTTQNNGFNLQSITAYKKKVYLTDFESGKILVIHADSVKGNGAAIPFLHSFRLSSGNRPLGLNFYDGFLFVTCSNQTILKLDADTGEVLDTITEISGFGPVVTPGRLFFDGKYAYLSSRYATSSWLKRTEMVYVEFNYQQ